VSGFQQSTGITYPLCIAGASTRTAYQAYEGLDVSIVIDQQGIIRYRGGGVDVSEIKMMIDNLIAVNNIAGNIMPRSVALFQNKPNPFNPSTVISFYIESKQKVSLIVYNNQGRFIRTLLENTMHAGRHSIDWDGKNISGNHVSSGVYFYVLRTADNRIVKKMTLIR
jgi:hypothetical protein